MKWIYGRQDWKTLERGLENCYLLTNGLGGFSSLTMTVPLFLPASLNLPKLKQMALPSPAAFLP